MELKANEAYSHLYGLKKWCKEIEMEAARHVTKLGVGRAHNRKGVKVHKCKEPIEVCTDFVGGERVMLMEYCFAEVCNDLKDNDIADIYIKLTKRYSKEQILSKIPKLRLDRELRFLRDAPNQIDSVKELELYFKLIKERIKMPKCNYTIWLNKHQHALTDRWSIRPDFYWPKDKLAIEFQSEKHHMKNKDDIRKDEEKLNVYAEMGIKCFQINDKMMKDPIKFKAMIRMIKNALAPD
ncbi:MAG: hypothetical protein LBN08_01455 [Lactobacillales bacterium]|jgi:hypothetical protein|nr:hypothetical protein [Lactobacillales bacterium]